jgi:hypothetical protein
MSRDREFALFIDDEGLVFREYSAELGEAKLRGQRLADMEGVPRPALHTGRGQGGGPVLAIHLTNRSGPGNLLNPKSMRGLMRYAESFDYFEDRLAQQMRDMPDVELQRVVHEVLNIARQSGLRRSEINRMLASGKSVVDLMVATALRIQRRHARKT